MYDPHKGGRYEVFNERLIKPEITKYCAQDVEMLPLLWEAYGPKLRTPANAFMRSQVRQTTKGRIKLSQRANYDRQAESKKNGWDPHDIDRSLVAWNEDVMDAAMKFDETLDEYD
jgi:exonuclease 3'-5' domain-containing protein 1